MWIFRIFAIVAISSLIQAAEDVPYQRDRCTAIVVGKDASREGYTMTTHTNDCAECDWRVNRVPAQDWPEGYMRPIYLISGSYPRQVREDRGETWRASNLEDMPQKPQWEKTQIEILGYIPQVSHTYAIIEGNYGIMNEHQVAIGESTCAAKLFAPPTGKAGGKALLEASELSQIALERAKTAREAIKIMGSLAEQYGFYSADWDTSRFGPSHAMGEGGEALTVIDKTEAWMFHILPDDTGASAVWVAQRVPDNHISVAANQFVIRHVPAQDSIDPDEFMMSSNLHDVAQRLGWWSPAQGSLDFLTTFAPQRYHPNYSNIRVWRVFTKANPTLQLDWQTDSYASTYPFSVEVPPSNLLSVEDVMNLNRDHYQGTEFDTEKGLAAGPYGDPNRYDLWSWGNMTVWDAMEGEFPRTISLFRTSYSFVAVGRSQVPDELSLLWYSQYAPDMASYTPLYLLSEQMPKPFIRGTMHKYDTNSAWWNFCVVGNYVARFYYFAVHSVRELQDSLYQTSLEGVNLLESRLLASLSGSTQVTDAIRKKWVPELTAFTVVQGVSISEAWKNLFPLLLTKYRDGYVMKNLDQPTIAFDRMFYPRWWLEAVGYFKIGGNKEGIYFASNPFASSSSSANSWLTHGLMLLVGMGLGIMVLSLSSRGKKVGSTGNQQGYRYVAVPEVSYATTTTAAPAAAASSPWWTTEMVNQGGRRDYQSL